MLTISFIKLTHPIINSYIVIKKRTVLFIHTSKKNLDMPTPIGSNSFSIFSSLANKHGNYVVNLSNNLMSEEFNKYQKTHFEPIWWEGRV